MEAFESFVALTMEAEGLVVSEAIKFPVTVPVPSREGKQTHGFEVDPVGARADRLVLATVKSSFGSRGVAADHVMGLAPKPQFNRLYALLNNPIVREGVVVKACERYGYPVEHVELRLSTSVASPATVPALTPRESRHGVPSSESEVDRSAFSGFRKSQCRRRVASIKTYRDNSALVAIKVLEAAGMLMPEPPDGTSGGSLRSDTVT